MNDKIYINVFPQDKPWKERLTIIFHVLFGLTYHHWITRENWEKLGQSYWDEINKVINKI